MNKPLKVGVNWVADDERSSVKLAYSSGYFMCGSDVFTLPLPGTEKLIYIALTRYAGSSNRAWPSYEKLAKDGSCSVRRAIDAVNRLCACRLVMKEKRGNRSNLYMVFPPKHYCEKHHESDSAEINEGADPAPQNNGENISSETEGADSAPSKSGVQNLHAEGAPAAPSICSDNTLRVQNLHPNINKNINKIITTTKGDEEESIPINPNDPDPNDPEAIKKAFKEKRTTVKDILIDDLLQQYPAKDIIAAIKCTDFEQARNPIAVIKYMLREGNYVMPADRVDIHVDNSYIREKPPLVDDEAVRKMFEEARAALTN